MSFIEYLTEKYGADARWITVHPGGKGERKGGGKKKGIPVLISKKDGTILGGMGGQFDGVKIGDVHKQGSSPSPGKASERLREIEKDVSRMSRKEMLSALEKAVAEMKPEATDQKEIHTSLDIKALKLPEITEDALSNYTRSGYNDINDYLRGKPSDRKVFIEEDIELIDEAMDKSVVKKPFCCYRGMDVSPELLKKFANAKPGDLITDGAYISTSTKEEESFPGNVKMKIIVPKNAKALSMMRVSEYPTEMEVLLDRKAGLRVLDIKAEKGYNEYATKVYRMTLIYEPSE